MEEVDFLPRESVILGLLICDSLILKSEITPRIYIPKQKKLREPKIMRGKGAKEHEAQQQVHQNQTSAGLHLYSPLHSFVFLIL